MNICSKKAIVDYRTEKEAVERLKAYGFDVVFTKKAEKLHKAVDGHTDLQIVKVLDSFIVCPEHFDYYKEKLGINLISGKTELSEKYPYDIPYNMAVFGKFAVHNFQFADFVLRECIKRKFLFEIETKQGYSKCSICVVSDNAIITEDENIFKAVSGYNIDVLKIDKGSVKLNGFNYGFFGGATGLLDNTLFVNGELKYHTDSERIKQFCKKHNTDIIELKCGEITDIGSILFII